MNSVEMTNNPSQNDGQNDLPSLSHVREEFTFNTSTSKTMKLLENFGRFKWYGLAIMAFVVIIMFATFNTSSNLKAEFPVSFTQEAKEKNSNLVLSDKSKELNSLWSLEDSESSDTTDDEEGETSIKSVESKKITEETFDIEQGVTVLAADGTKFPLAWRALRSQLSRFVVFRQNVWNVKLVDAKLGKWDSTFTEFKAEFPPAENAVGFIFLGNKGQERLYEVVYIPSSMDVPPADVMAKYGLPTDPNVLVKYSGLPVAHTIIIKTFRELNALNIMKTGQKGGIIQLWQEPETENENESTDDEEPENAVQSLWGWSSSSPTAIASDGSAYEDVWAALKDKTNKFVVFRQNTNNSKSVDVDSGNWDAIFPQFSSLFQATKPQVGYIWLGTKNHEQLYEIVYCPVALRTNPATVMVNFGLPPNPSKLATSYGLPLPYTFVATEKKQIDTGNIIMKAVAGGIIP